MFLVGGPAFSGTTLLAHLLTQGDVTCLDEPDFHNPAQRERGLRLLRPRYPSVRFPDLPAGELPVAAAADFLEECQRRINPGLLGMKTCNWLFIEYAREFRRRGHPVVAMVRDIRDALVHPPPGFVGEDGLNQRYRLIWENRDLYDYWFRYEDLVRTPDRVMAEIARVLDHPLSPRPDWKAEEVPGALLKMERHTLLRRGRVVADRVGIWKSSGVALSPASLETARMMGYE